MQRTSSVVSNYGNNNIELFAVKTTTHANMALTRRISHRRETSSTIKDLTMKTQGENTTNTMKHSFSGK